MHFIPLHSLGNLEIPTISQVHCQLFETKQMNHKFLNWTAKIALRGCVEVPFCAFCTKQVPFTSQTSFSKSPFCKLHAATLRTGLGGSCPLSHPKDQPRCSRSLTHNSAGEACSWKESLSLVCWFCCAAGKKDVLMSVKYAGWNWKSDG